MVGVSNYRFYLLSSRSFPSLKNWSRYIAISHLYCVYTLQSPHTKYLYNLLIHLHIPILLSSCCIHIIFKRLSSLVKDLNYLTLYISSIWFWQVWHQHEFEWRLREWHLKYSCYAANDKENSILGIWFCSWKCLFS